MPDEGMVVRLRLRPDVESDESRRDVARIVAVFLSRGCVVTEADARVAWKRYSETMAAGWMGLPADDEFVYSHAIPYFDEVPSA